MKRLAVQFRRRTCPLPWNSRQDVGEIFIVAHASPSEVDVLREMRAAGLVAGERVEAHQLGEIEKSATRPARSSD